jgi:hypothetical protein
MPAYTSPDNIQYPVSTDQVAPLETVFANLADSTQTALTGFRGDWNNFNTQHAIRTFRWANAAARTAQTGMAAGDRGYQIDTATDYVYTGSAWTVNTGGLIKLYGDTFSGVSSRNFFNSIPSGFAAHRIVFELTTSAATMVTLRLASGATVQTGAVYQRQILQGAGTNAAASRAENLGGFETFSLTNVNWASAGIDVFGASNASSNTRITSTVNVLTGGLLVTGFYGGNHGSNTAIDGFTLTPATGTITGRVAVYGYVN